MKRALCVLALCALVGCSKEKEINPPAELSDFPAKLRVQRAWGAGVGGESERLRLGLGVAVNGDRVYAAGRGGDVAAFSLTNGRQLWRARTRAPLAGGTGADDTTVAVGSSDGWVIALDADDGDIRWRVQVNGEVLSAPAVSERAVVVRTVDGKLRALSTEDGRELWLYEQQVPRLSLRGTSKPVIADGMVICGFDNGKVAAVSLSDGALVWESIVAPARGRTELERLVDIDSAVRVDGEDVYVVGFQGRVAMLALETGQIWWSHEASSYRGLGMDRENLYLSTADGEVVALRRQTGAEVWRQNALSFRGLSAPVALEDSVAVADFQGYVHWLSKETGEIIGRANAGGTRVSNAPVNADGLLVVINDGGQLAAFRATPLLAAGSREDRRAAADSDTQGE